MTLAPGDQLSMTVLAKLVIAQVASGLDPRWKLLHSMHDEK